MSRDGVELTREELYAKVWSKPATELAKEFGISDVGLAKICRKMNVPKPGRGYWRRLEVGERPQLTPLPKSQDRLPTLVVVKPYHDPSAFKAMAEEASARIQAESDPANRILVADNLRNAHPVIKTTRDELKRRSTNRVKGVWSPPQRACLDVRVSSKTMRRALLLMDALLKALEARGYSIEVGTAERQCTTILVGLERVCAHLDEEYDHSENKETNPAVQDNLPVQSRLSLTPSWKLRFVIDESWPYGGRKRWRDGKRHTLEEQLNDVVAGIVTVAEALRIRRVEKEEEERLRLEARRRWEEQERLRKREEDRRKALDLQADLWTKSRNLREFIAACERHLQASAGSVVPDGPEARWLAWAKRYADQLDPLRNGRLAIVVERAFTDAQEEEKSAPRLLC